MELKGASEILFLLVNLGNVFESGHSQNQTELFKIYIYIYIYITYQSYEYCKYITSIYIEIIEIKQEPMQNLIKYITSE